MVRFNHFKLNFLFPFSFFGLYGNDIMGFSIRKWNKLRTLRSQVKKENGNRKFNLKWLKRTIFTIVVR